MKRIALLITLLFTLLGFSSASQALNDMEAEDLADLSAIFIFLKSDCGYNDLPSAQIKRALVYFAQQNHWDLSNYNRFDMKRMSEESYHDLSGIAIDTQLKCQSLARDSMSLLAYAN